MMLRILILAVCLSNTCASTAAEYPRPAVSQPASPESMPAYADARTLREDASLRAVAFADSQGGRPGIGVACGDRGTIVRTEDSGQTWTVVESPVDCSLGDVTWCGPERVVVVGGAFDRITRISRGVVLYSDDAGRHWKRADADDLPRFVAVRPQGDGSLIAYCDWSHSLLTHHLESHDDGRTWNAIGNTAQHKIGAPVRPAPTELSRWATAIGMPVTTRAVCRVDSSTLCAVGDHGIILLGGDNGDSWQAVRGDQRRTAILFVANQPTTFAWPLMGRETLEHRNRAALLFYRPGGADPHQGAADLELANQVAVMLGGSGADAIGPEGCDMAAAAKAWINVQRPAVLVLDPSLPSHIHDAFFQAATSTGQGPDSNRRAPLQDRQSTGVARVVSYGLEAGGNVTLHRDAMLPRSGVLASDLHADAMHYLAPDQAVAKSISLRYLYDTAAGSRRGATVAGGVRLGHGQRLSAPPGQASRRQLQIVQARMKQGERIENLIRTAHRPEQFSEALDATLDQTAKQDRFRLIWSVLIRARTNSAGIDLRKAVLDRLAARFPNTSAGRWARLRSESIRLSLEWQRLRTTLADPASHALAAPTAQSVHVSPFQVAAGVRQASALSPVVVPKGETQRLTKQPEVKDEVDLTWEFHPLVLIAREAARMRGDDGGLQVPETSADLRRLAQATSSPWARFIRRGGSQTVIARRAAAPPKLDGIVDDACWQSALPSAGQLSRLRVAYDDDYVYVATQCDGNQLHADTMAAPAGRRDHELSNVDRMRLQIDIDRDLITAMQLQVTDAGRTHDAIDSDPGWQPTWYVDTRRDADRVTVEMAILRRDLVDLPIAAGESWYMSAAPVRAGSDPSMPIVPDPRRWSQVLFQP